LWDWIEGQLVITSVEAGATHGMVAGDRVLTINGRPVAAALAEIESLTSAATPQWRLLRSLNELAGGQPGDADRPAARRRARPHRHRRLYRAVRQQPRHRRLREPDRPAAGADRRAAA